MADSPKPPQPPKFYPVNIPKTMADALSADIAGYDWSDEDMARRFPGLVTGRNREIEAAFQALTGPLDPTVQGEFVRGGLGAGLGAVGGGTAMGGMALEEGSFASNAATASVGRNVLDKQDQDRTYFDSLIGSNPQRAFGLSGADVANLNIANTGGLNASNQQAYAGQIQAATAKAQADMATTQALVGMMNSIAGIYVASAR